MKFLFALLVVFSFTNVSNALACTGALVGSGTNVAVGMNIGWFWQLEAALGVNKRGVAKYGMIFEEGHEPARWTSRFGSVTLNPIGLEFPLGGMNEMGLTVQGLHSYDGPYDTAPTLPAMSMFQWIQYQLDMSATITEAAANARAVRPMYNPQLTLHYLVCEASGRCAVFEWLNSQVVIHGENDALPLNVFTNSSYASSLAAFAGCETESCPLPNDSPNFSLKRFVQAARQVRAYSNEQNSSDYLFNLLASVRQQGVLTSWSVVAESAGANTQLPFSFRLSGPGDAATQYIDLRAIDFSCATPAQMLRVDLSIAGQVNDRLAPYDRELQRLLVAGTMAPEERQSVMRELPERMICVNP